MIRNVQSAENFDEVSIYEELDQISRQLEEQKFENFEATYNNRKTYNKINYARPLLIALLLVFLIILLIFTTNNLIYVDVNDIATIKSENNTSRGNVIELVNSAVQESHSDSTAILTLSGVPYYTMDIPFSFTLESIGGIAMPNYSKNYMPSYIKETVVGGDYGFGRFGSLEAIASSDWSSTLKDCAADASYDDTGCAQIGGRYLAAIGSYFFPSSKKYTDFSITSTGYCYDVVLKDGTTIPFIKFDSKSDYHTNGQGKDDGTYTRGTLNMSDYAHIFQCYDGSIVEIITKDANSLNALRDKYGQSESNPIVQVIMYNAKYN